MQNPSLHQAKKLRKIALPVAAEIRYSLLNTLNQPEHVINSFKKEAQIDKRKDNTKKAAAKRLTIEDMLAEIYRLKDLTFIYPRFTYEMIQELPDNTYDYYFAYFHAQKALQLEDTSDDKAAQLQNFVDLFNDYLNERYNEEDMYLVGMVLIDMEDFARYEADFTELNELMADYFLDDEDQLLEYFRISYDNNYTKVLIKLKEFSNYLAFICYERSDYKTFIKIKDLYVDPLDDNYDHFVDMENQIQRSLRHGTITNNVRAELLERTPRIDGGGSQKNNFNYGTILVSAVIIGIASIM